MVTVIRRSDGHIVETDFECDECSSMCYPGSYDPRKWLYNYNKKELCWDCFLAETGAEIVE